MARLHAVRIWRPARRPARARDSARALLVRGVLGFVGIIVGGLLFVRFVSTRETALLDTTVTLPPGDVEFGGVDAKGGSRFGALCTLEVTAIDGYVHAGLEDLERAAAASVVGGRVRTNEVAPGRTVSLSGYVPRRQERTLVWYVRNPGSAPVRARIRVR